MVKQEEFLALINEHRAMLHKVCNIYCHSESDRQDMFQEIVIQSWRALKYKEWKLKDKNLSEDDYRKYILDEYTFLKRPVVIMGEQIFIGSEKKTVAALKEALK